MKIIVLEKEVGSEKFRIAKEVLELNYIEYKEEE